MSLRWDELLELEWEAEWVLHDASWQRDLTWIDATEGGGDGDEEGRP